MSNFEVCVALKEDKELGLKKGDLILVDADSGYDDEKCVFLAKIPRKGSELDRALYKTSVKPASKEELYAWIEDPE